MKSMTAFAEIIRPLLQGQVRMSLRSVNHKALELNIRLHPALYPLENAIRGLIREKASRGKLDLFIEVQDEPALEPRINRVLLQNMAKAWSEEAGCMGMPPLSAEAFLRLPGAFSIATGDLAERFEKPVLESLQCLLASWNEAREHEAERLKPFFESAVSQLLDLHRQLSNEAELHDAELPEQYRQRLENILNDAGLKGQLPAERLIAEVGVLAERQDIREELTRLKAHLDDMVDRISLDRVVGKALDVWCQEVLREINTIASKCRRLAMTRAVMEAKGFLEQIREQGANLE